MPLLAEETKVVTIGTETIAVTDLPPQARQLLQFYDHWKQQELEKRSELMSIQTAMKGLAQQIAQVVEQTRAEEAKRAQAAELKEAPPAANE